MKLAVTLIVLFFLSINVPALAQSEASKLLQEGHKLNRTGDLDGAIEFYKKSLKANPEYSAAKSSLKGALKRQAILKIVETDTLFIFSVESAYTVRCSISCSKQIEIISLNLFKPFW